ncbi:MAG: hypothetical protein J6I96_00945 [Oscillospiraceae bacterium]|nr:hypothetical protein [Oscillospiraceae bacterium]
MGLFFEDDMTDLLGIGDMLKDDEIKDELMYEFNENYEDELDEADDDDDDDVDI